MSDYKHHVSFGPYTERHWPVWRAKVHIRRRISAPGLPERGYTRIHDLGWYWTERKAWKRACAYYENAVRISELAGHIVEREGSDAS